MVADASPALSDESRQATLAQPDFATLRTTPAELRVSQIVAVVMVAVALAAISFGRNPVLEVPVVLPLLMGSVIITELMSAGVLLSQFWQRRSRSLALVGAAYLLSGLLVIPYLLTFPHVFSATGWFGANEQTALMLWTVWHVAFPLLVFAYAFTEQRFGSQPLSPSRTKWVLFAIVGACVIVALAALALVIRVSPALPIFVQGGHFTPLTQFGLLPIIAAVDLAALIALVVILRGQTVTALWLSLAVLASLFDAAMGLLCHRYSIGWYTGKVFAVASSSFILGGFIYEFIGLSRRLGLANIELRRLSTIEQQQAEQRIAFLANHDALTGLTNRARLHERLAADISKARRLGNPIALLVVDIDHFKTVNEAYGRPVGDRVLVEAARRLTSVARTSEPVSRLGPDEFGVIANGIASVAEAELIARRLRRAFKAPFMVGERTVNVSGSVGIALCPDDGHTPEALVEHAEAAAFHARLAGGDDQHYYNKAIA
jgi:diguanylate cyclase (GGDEF)-like protein